MARSVGKPVERQIRSAFILWLMEQLDCRTITELEEKTKIRNSTLATWAYDRGSPLRSLVTTQKLLISLGHHDAAKDIAALVKACDALGTPNEDLD